jgi:hypothetical protein
MPAGIENARNVTVDDCATLCSLQTECSAFSYNDNIAPLATLRIASKHALSQCHTDLVQLESIRECALCRRFEGIREVGCDHVSIVTGLRGMAEGGKFTETACAHLNAKSCDER